MANTNQAFVLFQSESSWGTTITPTDFYIPLDDYGVKLNVESRQAKAACGVRQVKYNERVHATPQGSIRHGLSGQWPLPSGSPSFAQYLLEWCFGTPEVADRASKTIHLIQQGDGGTQKKHTGLRVTQATLTGKEDGFVELSIDVIGKQESSSSYSASLPDDRSGLWQFLFADAVFSIGGVTFPIGEFAWQIQYGLKPKFSSGFTPTVLRGPQGLQTLTIKQPKTGGTYEAYHRLTTTTEKVAQLSLQGLHGGSGASGDFTRVVIDFNKLSMLTSEDELVTDGQVENPISFQCLKPNSGTAAVAMTWSLV